MRTLLIMCCMLVLFNTSHIHPQSIFQTDFLTTQESLEVASILSSYGDLITNVETRGNEIIFCIGNTEIHYCDGKMLAETHISEAVLFDSIFYKYKKGALTVSFRAPPYPVYRSSDFLDALFGRTEIMVRAESRWVDFLGHRVFVHRVCADPLMQIDRRITDNALTSKKLREFLSDIKVMYSMKRRQVSGTNNMSYHSYGLAIDIIPKGYRGKQVYWRWSSVFQEEWERIPAELRWQPPQEIIDAFEENGFVWGGKWHYFDNVHFEYRPEILWLSDQTHY